MITGELSDNVKEIIDQNAEHHGFSKPESEKDYVRRLRKSSRVPKEVLVMDRWWTEYEFVSEFKTPGQEDGEDFKYRYIRFDDAVSSGDESASGRGYVFNANQAEEVFSVEVTEVKYFNKEQLKRNGYNNES